ncbi:MAG: hypothetical protein NTU48_00735 [Legionellales bacterium]|nr:hypothetical protein [Legionellales bacterium]
MFAILVALPEEARGIVARRMRVGDTHRLSDKAELIVTGMGESAGPIIRRTAALGVFSTLISLGTAVGLDPTLTPGMVCIPDEVVFNEQSVRCHQTLQHDFIEALKANHVINRRRLTHTSTVLTCLQEKQALHQKSSAVVADMESFLIGQEAIRYQLQFLAVRVIVDSLHVHIPQSILQCCVPSILLPQLLWRICRQPKLLASLVILAKNFQKAKKNLSAVTQVKILK